jgi:rubrerythrin
MDAIRMEAGPSEEAGARDDEGPLFDELATSAESVRWSLGDVPWHEVDPALASAELRSVVREMAFSENATYSATQRFLESFYDDVDFSKWLSVWFYEETRHPHVLIEWLSRVGEPVSADFVARGRVSTPFMRSAVGTLITNVISEITAAQAYRRLAARSPEPVLATLARYIAGDEARHAATFFRFARRQLARAPSSAAWRDRARGLEVLQAWLGGSRQTTHPVAQMVDRLNEAPAGATAVDIDSAAVRARVVRTVALLLDVPLRRQEDVAPALRELLAERQRS